MKGKRKKKLVIRRTVRHTIGINIFVVLRKNWFNIFFDDDYIFLFIINPQNNPARGQVQICHNLMVNTFQKRNSPCRQKLFEVRIKRQTIDHYLPGISKITSN